MRLAIDTIGRIHVEAETPAEGFRLAEVFTNGRLGGLEMTKDLGPDRAALIIHVKTYGVLAYCERCDTLGRVCDCDEDRE